MALASIDIEQLTREIEHLRERLAQETRRANTAEARARMSEAAHEADKEKWRIAMQSLGKEDMGDREKIDHLFIQMDFENYRTTTGDITGDIPVCFKTIGNRRGKNDGEGISKTAHMLEEAGLMRVDVDRERSEDGKVRSSATIHQEGTFTERMRRFVDLDVKKALPDKPKPGGARTITTKCQTCGSLDTDMTCRACGAVHDTAGIPSADSNPKVRKTQDIGTATARRENKKRNKHITPPSPQNAEQGYVLPPYPGERTLVPQNADSVNPAQSFDPDDYQPEPPQDLLWDDGQDAWLNA